MVVYNLMLERMVVPETDEGRVSRSRIRYSLSTRGSETTQDNGLVERDGGECRRLSGHIRSYLAVVVRSVMVRVLGETD